MTSREIVIESLNHRQTQRVPLDLGATPVSGISASVLYQLRAALGLPRKPIKVIEPGQMLGEVDEDVRKALGIDVVGLWRPKNNMGVKNADYKPWDMMDGTPVLMPGGFACMTDERGDVLAYPQGDKSVPPSLRMPKGGYFFDGIDRSAGYDEDDLDDWLVAHLLYPDYIHELFEFQLDVVLQNLAIYRDAVGERIQVLYLMGTDFGMQSNEMISPEQYREFYKPRIKKAVDWIHRNTGWKVMIHSCGSIVNLIDEICDTGVDILNPVQCSAAGMDASMLKQRYGSRISFWGGGVDTQRVLPFGTPDEVRGQVRERLDIFSKGGGFVFNTIHNIVGGTPVENLTAMYDVVKSYSV